MLDIQLRALLLILLAYGGIIIASGLLSRVLYQLLRRYWRTDKLDAQSSSLPLSILLSISALIMAFALFVLLYAERGAQIGLDENGLNRLITFFIALPIIFLIIWHEIVEPLLSAIWRALRGQRRA